MDRFPGFNYSSHSTPSWRTFFLVATTSSFLSLSVKKKPGDSYASLFKFIQTTPWSELVLFCFFFFFNLVMIIQGNPGPPRGPVPREETLFLLTALIFLGLLWVRASLNLVHPARGQHFRYHIELCLKTETLQSFYSQFHSLLLFFF